MSLMVLSASRKASVESEVRDVLARVARGCGPEGTLRGVDKLPLQYTDLLLLLGPVRSGILQSLTRTLRGWLLG